MTNTGKVNRRLASLPTHCVLILYWQMTLSEMTWLDYWQWHGDWRDRRPEIDKTVIIVTNNWHYITAVQYSGLVQLMNLCSLTEQFTTSCKQSRTTKTANITKDDITSQHSDISAMCCDVISSFVVFAVLVDICCFSCATLLLSSLWGVVNCQVFINRSKGSVGAATLYINCNWRHSADFRLIRKIRRRLNLAAQWSSPKAKD